MQKLLRMNLSVYTKEFSYNIKLAYPIILSMLGHTLVGVIDNIMVGKIGATELAAASLANSFVFIGMSVLVGFSSAITPLVASSDAEGNIDKGKRVLVNGLWLTSVLGVIIFLLLFALKPYLHYMKQSPEVTTMARPFLDIVALSLIPLAIFQAMKQFTDGKSLTKYSMYATIISNVINVFFNYVLIYGVWFFPEMGMMGAAYGTLISRIAMLIYMAYVLKFHEIFKPYVSNVSWNLLDKNISKTIAKIGFPSSMQSLFEVGLFTGAVWISGVLGTSAQAANQIALSISSMTFMFASGLSVAAMIRVGNNMGSKNYIQAKVVSQSMMLMALILYVGFAIMFFLFNNLIPLLFLDVNDTTQWALNQEVIAIASKLLLIAALFQIVDGIQVVTLGSLRGMQDVNIPMILTFISYWIIGFGLCIYLSFYTNLGAQGIWYGLLGGLASAAIFLYIRFELKTKTLINSL